MVGLLNWLIAHARPPDVRAVSVASGTLRFLSVVEVKLRGGERCLER